MAGTTVLPESQHMSDAIARIYPSPARRWFGTITLAVLGGLLIWTSLAHPAASIVWTILLLGFGIVSVWGAVAAYQATGRGIELTKEGLIDSEGVELARIEDIKSVVSGPLAFKPSNGFTVRLKRRYKAAWAPGLWWRFGGMLGVGGMTTGVEAKFMAELINKMISEREEGPD